MDATTVDSQVGPHRRRHGADGGLLLGGARASPSPVTYTGRVELADEGMALTLDPTWWAEPGPGGCDLWIDRKTDLSSGSLIAYTEQLIRDYERGEDGTKATYEQVSLPAGPATRVRIEDGRLNPLAHTEYVLQRDGVAYRLACMIFDPRDDDWLSIAEAIEFLPEEG